MKNKYAFKVNLMLLEICYCIRDLKYFNFEVKTRKK